jgi:VWFA-related protein
LASTLAACGIAAWAQEPTVLETTRVDRVLVDARILDPRGRELRGLRIEDLRVEIDGKAARVESVEWVSEAASHTEGAAPAGEVRAGDGTPSRAVEAPGRLVVFLFQKDFFEPGRLKGLLHMKEYAADFVRRLGAQDRAAVLTFDSHLRLHLDLTGDRDQIQDALRHALLRDEPSEVAAATTPSLGALLDREASRRAATPEKGLEVLARALENLPGAKSLVFFCWGLGQRHDGQVRMTADYAPARSALERSRTAVFALDVSNADYHSLEVGLQRVAEDTGGFYARTHDSPLLAMDRLNGALSGHYVLSLERPAGSRGTHRVAVDLRGRKGTVLARATYVD